MVGLVALDLVPGFALARTAAVPLALEILGADLRARAAAPARLGVSTEAVAHRVPLAHALAPASPG
jgi:hypothetical protein